MKCRNAIAALVLAPIAAAQAASDADVARQALRDGLWDVARTHAEAAGSREIVMESYAREERWDELSKTLSAWRKADESSAIENAFPSSRESNDAYAYYTALALAERGERERAAKFLSGIEFRSQEYHELAVRLKARLALEAGDAALALKLIKEIDLAKAGPELKSAAAGIFLKAGETNEAVALWKDVTLKSDPTSREFAVAAANLEDEALMRKSAIEAWDVKVRRFSALKLGMYLIKSPSTFAEGESAIRRTIRDAPDSEGAKEAATALAFSLVEKESWPQAEETLRKLLEIWPALAQDGKVQEAYAWTLRRLGRTSEAVEAFSRAEAAAADDETRASAILGQGDTLSEAGSAQKAMERYRKVLDSYPGTSAAAKLRVVVKRRELEAKAREHYKDYRFAEAQKVFAELAELAPECAGRCGLLSVMCLYAQGLDREAAEKAQALAESASEPEVRSDVTLWLAKLAYNEERWSDAAKQFVRFADSAKKDPRAPGALVWAARACAADGDFKEAIRIVTQLSETYPVSSEKPRALVVQAEALMELGRYDEAVLVIERAISDGAKLSADERRRADILKADSLFALGADNPVRYREALDAYLAVRQGESLTPGLRLAVSFKVGRTLEKLKRMDEAIDQYYTGVVLAYREGRQKGVQFDDEARAAFSRAAFRLADEYESRGRDFQAMHILELVVASGVSAADEAEKRLDRIQTKGKFL